MCSSMMGSKVVGSSTAPEFLVHQNQCKALANSEETNQPVRIERAGQAV